VPSAPARATAPIEPRVFSRSDFSLPSGKLVLVIDDDPLVREGMGGILRSWGCQVIAADTDSKALKALNGQDQPPDLIISDYHLADGATGPETIERLRSAFSAQIPAFLISGDTDSEPLRQAKAKGYYLLHKPVDPMALRAMFNQATRHVPIIHTEHTTKN
jgi:CheY-like chemotaxis protein